MHVHASRNQSANDSIGCVPSSLSQEQKEKQLKNEDRTMKEGSDPARLSETKKSFELSVLKDPLCVVYMCDVVISMSGMMSVYSFLPSFLHSNGLDLRETAAIYSMYVIVAAIPR